jgi:tripartite-type tricarboxylate transporter receptor subunit TctC
MKRRAFVLAGAAWPLTGAAATAWPKAPLARRRAAGGRRTADALARMLGERLEGRFGVAVVVDNRPGANGLLGTDYVRRAAPDGYTLLLASTATHAMARHTSTSLAFDPVRDFSPIVNVAWQTKVALSNPSVPATTLREFVAYARAHPGRLNYASTGVGSSSHLDAELFAAATGLKLVHIPYRGSGQTVAALAAGEVQILFASVTAALGAIHAAQVRALAILSDRRSTLLPQVPTIGEAGVVAPDVRTWIGLVAPADTSREVVAALNGRSTTRSPIRGCRPGSTGRGSSRSAERPRRSQRRSARTSRAGARSSSASACARRRRTPCRRGSRALTATPESPVIP